MGGGLLLLEHEEEHGGLPLRRIAGPRGVPGVLMLLWVLLVLSFSARLYDPLLHLVPLFTLAGLGLLAGASWRSRLMVELSLIAALLPAQVLINRFLPTGFLAAATAQISSMMLWLIGMPAYAEGHLIVLPDRLMRVDASCTGVNTLSLCLAVILMLWLLAPLPLLRRGAGSGLGILVVIALAAAFLVNAVRIALLGLASRSPSSAWYGSLKSFEFWHEGLGSHLFSLVAMSLVCGLYALVLELSLPTNPPQRP
jgi:exosortase/archaeosortase family protein